MRDRPEMTRGNRPRNGPTQTRARRRSLLAQLSAPARQFLRTEAGGAVLLLVATLTALAWANSPWSGGYEFLWQAEASLSVAGWELSMDLGHWVNDGLMAVSSSSSGWRCAASSPSAIWRIPAVQRSRWLRRSAG